MTEKPTGPGDESRKIEPLAPPPGRFEQVYRESRRRRYNRAAAVCGVAGVFLAGLFGGLALAGPRSAVVQAIEQAADFVSPPSPSPSGGTDSSTVASTVPHSGKKGHTRSASATVPVTAPSDRIADQKVEGLVVDAAGQPVDGLYVYPGVSSEDGFIPSGRYAITDGDGTYEVTCTGGPLLVTSWPLNQEGGSSVTGSYAARLIPALPCGRAEPVVTTVQPGAVVEGTVRTDTSCDGTELKVWLWVLGNRAASVRLGELSEGGTYRISGLPSGTSVFGDRGRLTPVELTAGKTTRQPLTLVCPNPSPPPTDDPSIPQVTPTATATATSQPSPSDPEPSASTTPASGATSASSPSGTAR